jgi:F-type H+-transporting ATPase subunit a
VEKKKPQRKFAVLVEYLVESIYNFFEEILGEKAPFWIKSYVTNLFLIILIANVIGLLLDILISPFPVLEQYIQNPTGDISFTLALAVCSIFIVLRVEAKTKGLGSFLYSYFPVWGTDLFKLSKKSESVWMFYLIRPFAKVFDIVISLFIGILNIIGIIAKVISLAFRLYGNMMAGSLLLMIIV